MRILILGLLISLNTQASTLLVSDVDDTIKNSSVLDLDSAGANLTYKNYEYNEFLGMAQLYRRIRINNPSTVFKYLSNGINAMAGERHQKFLNANAYPAGALDMNMTSIYDRVKKEFRHNEETGPGHKITKLREYLTNSKYDSVVLIGDNGERDIEIYDQITKEFPKIKFYTFIHVVYTPSCDHGMCGKNLKPNQMGYVTAADLAIQLFELDFITVQDVKMIAYTIHQAMYSQGFGLKRGQGIIFPAWLNCNTFEVKSINFERVEELVEPEYSVALQNIFELTKVRCKIPLISK